MQEVIGEVDILHVQWLHVEELSLLQQFVEAMVASAFYPGEGGTTLMSRTLAAACSRLMICWVL